MPKKLIWNSWKDTLTISTDSKHGIHCTTYTATWEMRKKLPITEVLLLEISRIVIMPKLFLTPITLLN